MNKNYSRESPAYTVFPYPSFIFGATDENDGSKFHCILLLGLFFDPDDEGDMLLREVC
jgi:hypothetical protein